MNRPDLDQQKPDHGPVTVARERKQARACVVGYGIAGRLHAEVLTDLGVQVTVVDPGLRGRPEHHRSLPHQIDQLPPPLAAETDLWSVCCPTADHLSVLRAILAHDPTARVLLEKPACQGHEINAFADLVARHPRARIVVNDQYRHATVLPALTELVGRLEPGVLPSHVTVTFTKNRARDIADGRFVDRTYGVLGYEWLHMLTVLSCVLPAQVMGAYLRSDPTHAELWATYDPRLFVAALTERTTVDLGRTERVQLELASSILGPSVLLGAAPDRRAPWHRDLRPVDDRHRHIGLHAGTTRFALHLEPVTVPDGWQLDRNHHRLTAERAGHLLYDEVLHDSPMDTSVRHAATLLLDDTPPPLPDLNPLRRIAALADLLRAQDPMHAGSETNGTGA